MKNTSKNTTTNNCKSINSKNLEVLYEDEIRCLEEKPVQYYLFILCIGAVIFFLVMLIGALSVEVPWGNLTNCACFIALGIGIWLWGYYSHKPAKIIITRYVRAKAPAKKATKEARKPVPEKKSEQTSNQVSENATEQAKEQASEDIPEQPKEKVYVPSNPNVNLNAIYHDRDLQGDGKMGSNTPSKVKKEN